MSQPTQTYKRSFAGSMGAGMGSIINGKGKTYYILEHKVSSQYHRAGEAQEIIVDQIELGRDPKCAVRFDESFKTVSRRHAAIVRDGQNWKLVQLSQTNTTFLNGRPVQNEWYLQNGDEIQLSVNGPKLGFIVPTGNKSTVGSIGLSRRLSLFRQQALRPYKTAMWTLAAVLLLVIAGGTWLGIHQQGIITQQGEEIAQGKATQDSINNALKTNEITIAQMQGQNEQLQKELETTKKKMQSLDKQLKNLNAGSHSNSSAPTVKSDPSAPKTIAACEPYIYYVFMRKIEIRYNGESRVLENVGSGTGFLLNDGRFVTARHVVEPWMFPDGTEDTNNLIMNAIVHDGGEVICHLDAYSPNGKVLHFTSKQAKVNRSKDEKYSWNDAVISVAPFGDTDWACFSTNDHSGLAFNNELSKNLHTQDKLTILGYPMGLGANSANDIHPLYSEAVVAKDGLDRGYILTTATTFEHGNSGGPVFITNSANGEMIVVGIVSAGAGRSTGLVVPISAVK